MSTETSILLMENGQVPEPREKEGPMDFEMARRSHCCERILAEFSEFDIKILLTPPDDAPEDARAGPPIKLPPSTPPSKPPKPPKFLLHEEPRGTKSLWWRPPKFPTEQPWKFKPPKLLRAPSGQEPKSQPEFCWELH